MKRKLFNAALFGAVLVAAPVSTFVSCADYDSDIAGVQQSVDDLKGVVNQKETEIKAQIANLQGQKDALDTRIAALEEAIAKTSTSVDLETCKAECKAARELLEKAIEDLEKSLGEAKTKIDAQGETISGLLSADGELQKGIDAARGDLTVLDGRLGELETLVGALADGLDVIEEDLRPIVENLPALRTQVNDINTELTNLKSFVSEELAKVRDAFAQADATLQSQITANKELIEGLRNSLNLTPEQFESLKELASLDLEFAANITSTIASLQEGSTVALSDIQELKAWCHDLETDAIAHGVQIDKNTKAIVDLLVRMVDAELAISEATDNLAKLVANFEVFTAHQEALDLAQDAEISRAVAAYYDQEKGVSYDFTNINEAYASALKAAKAAADVAYQNALSNTAQHYYTKNEIDALLAGVSSGASGDLESFIAEFREWVEVDLNGLLAEKFEDVDGQLEDIWSDINAIHSDVRDIQSGLHDLEGDVIANTAKIEAIEKAYKEADKKFADDFKVFYEELIGTLADMQDTLDALGVTDVALSKEVKSLVLEPDSYYQGIQAIEGTSYHYHAWNVTDPMNPVQSDGDATQYCPEVVAYYHVNPSTATLSDKVDQYKYAVLDREYRGSKNVELKPVITKVGQADGMLAVTMSLTAPAANKTNAGLGEVTVMALQYTNPDAQAADQVITSDYAALYLNPLNEVALVSATNSDHDVTDIFAQVVSNNDQDWVEYNKSYDIQEKIAAKFGGENSVSMTELPEGFTVKYTAVAGDVNYFTPITADGKITPKLPNDNAATTACIGKSATWRIDIMHGDDVVEVGFYKLTITGEAVVETANAVVTEDQLNITCVPTDEALNADLSLDNVWNKIKEVTGEELDVVKSKYSVTTADGKVVQYKQYTSNDKRVLYKQYEGKGVITLVGDKANWVVLNNNSYVANELRVEGDENSMTTYIRVRSNNAISKDTYNEFYLPLVWKPALIEKWGEYQPVHWTYKTVANQWQQSTNKEDEKELRLYANLNEKGSTPFTYNIPEKAMVNFDFEAIEFAEGAAALEFVNVKNGNITLTDGHFVFVQHPEEAARKTTVNGKEYVFTVSTDGDKFLANGVEIASITPEGVISLQNNATSQLLLNAYEKNQLGYGQTLCARVGFAAKCCAGAVKVINGAFDVRFIKPLTVKDTDINIKDAFVGEARVSVFGNIVAFNDVDLATDDSYIDLFGVGVTLGKVAEWKTNYNAAENDFTKTLEDNNITDLFSKDENKGEVIYTNNTAVVNEFSVIIPVKVHYNWNTDPISVNIKLNIGRTQGNSNRR